MNLVIFRELKRILKSKDITVTVDKNSSSHEFYIVEDFHGKEIIRYTHSNVDKNIYDMRVLGEQLVHWVNPAKSTQESFILFQKKLRFFITFIICRIYFLYHALLPSQKHFRQVMYSLLQKAYTGIFIA